MERTGRMVRMGKTDQIGRDKDGGNNVRKSCIRSATIGSRGEAGGGKQNLKPLSSELWAEYFYQLRKIIVHCTQV